MGAPYAEVIGDPVAYSRSPIIHKFWLGKLGIDADYRACGITPAELAGYLGERRHDPDWRGCNVTLPHKEQILPLLDRLEEEGVGAVNCVVPREGRLAGFNTDKAGIAGILAGAFHPDVEITAPVCLIGAGGGARAAMAGLRDVPVGRVNLVVRDLARGERLLESFGMAGKAYGFDEAGEALAGCIGVINATPLGMTGAPAMPSPVLAAVSTLHSDAFVFDMVYVPQSTSLLARAAEARLETIDGLDMLIGQAERAFLHFFGRAAPAGRESELRELLTG